MKATILVLTFIFFSRLLYGQDTTAHFEFGSTILTVNSFKKENESRNMSVFSHFGTGVRPPVELINGLFFRYTKNRLALRVQTSYSDFSSAHTYTTETWPYGPIGGNINNKDFRIGAGAQFLILAQHPWIYTCLDIAYRRVSATGSRYGGGFTSRKFMSTSNGADCFIGLGFRFKIINNFSLSPEVGCNTSIQFIDSESIATEPYMFINNPHRHTYSDLTAIPILKFHLTAKF